MPNKNIKITAKSIEEYIRMRVLLDALPEKIQALIEHVEETVVGSKLRCSLNEQVYGGILYLPENPTTTFLTDKETIFQYSQFVFVLKTDHRTKTEIEYIPIKS